MNMGGEEAHEEITIKYKYDTDGQDWAVCKADVVWTRHEVNFDAEDPKDMDQIVGKKTSCQVIERNVEFYE
ncbi:MAG: hypothetical protein IJ759_07110 [Bacteroidales bacterium]|nr:hypothetical protein [Bacteroidales bacterium]